MIIINIFKNIKTFAQHSKLAYFEQNWTVYEFHYTYYFIILYCQYSMVIISSVVMGYY